MRHTRPQKSPASYPEPFVVHPKSEEHRHTFIILHGRGSDGTEFGSVLLSIAVPGSSPSKLPDLFPHAKFVFPTASWRRAAIYKRSLTKQWFDNWSLNAPLTRQELQIEGLRESAAFIHSLLKDESNLVGVENVVLGGLSQGCATALISILT